MESLVDFANILIADLNTLPQTFDNYIERFLAWLIIGYFKWKLEVFRFAATIAIGFIQNIGIQNVITSSWNSIDGQIVAVLNYCRIPDALNLILTAFVTRFILGVIPF